MGVRDLVPRHTRGYLWIAFLVGVFMFMAMSENGIFSTDSVLPNPVLIAKANQSPLEVRPSDFKMPKAQSSTSTPTSLGGASQTPISHTSEPATKSTPVPTKEHPKTEELSFNGLSPNDIAILVKTGATSIWRRMPAHMSTTLSNPLLTPNIIYYSDSSDNLNGSPVLDVLANVSAALKATPDFALYTKAAEIADQNLYLESGSMEGDFYLPGGWRLDKYKFVPMFQHVAAYMPGKKWYVYMEDDNYFFWENLFSWLGTLDHTAPLLVGSPAFRLGEDFAHGGSGFAVSGKALEVSFGSDKGLAGQFEEYAKEQCCGDQVLSHVLHSKGVERYKELDGGGWAGLQSLPHWRIGFGTWNWCSPIMNVHKVHQRDISRLWVFEREFKEGGGKRLRYRDVFEGMAKAGMQMESRSEWDNYAAAKTFASSSDPDVNAGVNGGSEGSKISAGEMAKKPWYSKEACKKACVEWEQCLTWKYADDNCALDHTAAMGQKIDAGIRMESGWMIERIKKLEKTECEALTF
ncbi:uncharacterized protein LY89DRAFT_690101 [Mollisia scopiformis]|uniref:Glycosyltransferase family 31 protein n=1 Tax=Mollisia scopiformis TaxID=149040 RepID=A0A132BB79_MOLSC|nr:uncharacterized protein LY89DRAFT_690101 [Mollisia scopiformis]KUJ09646.1 hypothetical protein LY89DRAFT_690101 [Mollisia scopiformis]